MAKFSAIFFLFVVLVLFSGGAKVVRGREGAVAAAEEKAVRETSSKCVIGLGGCSADCSDNCCNTKCLTAYPNGRGYCDNIGSNYLCNCAYDC
ncbi:PREDICTED: defensin-like protein 183 [Tarenaya hassleriana]|uniref:defensin-like protein 183 n=1 Tax=Tarenaya hassleriana TaxID=28532 RepID=UPI00053C8081|nr:PREDICTED: defensin-like protein 183 [Tarenaya hassleriana]